MPSGLKTVVRRLRRMAGLPKISECNDRQLLERFAQYDEQAAFAALVDRHGALVLGVCRRVLQNAEDAEDAFQATFLVLARKADSGGWQNSIGNWLYGVAYRVALKIRGKRIRQRNRELEYRPETASENTPAEQMTWGEFRSVLDDELQSLPARYRAPLLLCYLEGKTRDEAAQQLGWSPGSVKGRLERGRELLRQRLSRRGLTISAVLCAALLPESGSAAVPAELAANTLQSATGFAAGQGAGLISPQVLSLAQGVMNAMFIAKMKVMGAVMVGVSLLTLGAVVTNSAFFPDENGREGVRAVVKSVDAQKGTITVHTFAGERPAEQATTYNLANKDVKVTVNERGAAKLADLVDGTRVLLRLSGDADVVAISAFAPSMRVRVKSIDAANKTITIFAGERGETKELKIAPDARIPEKLEADATADVVLSLDRSTVLALNAAQVRRDGERDPAERRVGAGVRGLALSVDPQKGTIEVLTGGEANPKITTYSVTKDTQFFINERPSENMKLENIPRAARITYRATDDGKISHLSLLSPMVGGVIGEIDVKAGTLSLRTEGEPKALKFTAATVVQSGERRTTTADLKAGLRVMVQLSLDGTQVETIRVYGLDEGDRRPAPREGEIRKDGDRPAPRRDGDVKKDGDRRDPPREGDARKDGDRPVERRDPQPREGGARDGDLKQPIQRRDGQ